MRQILREENRDALAVRRPVRIGQQTGEMRLLLRCAAAGRSDVELELIGFGAVGEERNLRAVGRPGDGFFVAGGLPIARANVDRRG